MNLLQLVLKQMRQRSLSTWLTLLSVLLGFAIVLLAAASLAYLLERHAHPDHPEAFASIPMALWWGIVTMTTTGYGDVVPPQALTSVFAGGIGLCGILLTGLVAAIAVSALHTTLMDGNTGDRECRCATLHPFA